MENKEHYENLIETDNIELCAHLMRGVFISKFKIIKLIIKVLLKKLDESSNGVEILFKWNNNKHLIHRNSWSYSLWYLDDHSIWRPIIERKKYLDRNEFIKRFSKFLYHEFKNIL